MGKGGGVSGSDGVLCPRVCLVFWVVSVCVCEYVSMCVIWSEVGRSSTLFFVAFLSDVRI